MSKQEIHCPHNIPISTCEEHWPIFQAETGMTSTKQHTSTEEDLEETALDFFIDALENHEIETGLPKASNGKGGYSISNKTISRLAQLISSRDEQREREIQHGVYTAVWKHVNPVITVMSDKVYLPIQDALQAAKKETGTYPLSPSNQSTKKGKV